MQTCAWRSEPPAGPGVPGPRRRSQNIKESKISRSILEVIRMTNKCLPTPQYSRNMRLIGYSDQGGRPDGGQIMGNRGYAYIGPMLSKGFSSLDVRDPCNPRPVRYVAAPDKTWIIPLQAYQDILLVIHAKDMFSQP